LKGVKRKGKMHRPEFSRKRTPGKHREGDREGGDRHKPYSSKSLAKGRKTGKFLKSIKDKR